MSLLSKIFNFKRASIPNSKKFLIVGLGNIGSEYKMTRHNVGFETLNYLSNKESLSFETFKLANKTVLKKKGKKIILIKPNTYMNLSGKSVKYWMNKEKIPIENILVITDELNLPFGKLRIRTKGSSGGHNGLKDIEEKLGTQNYSRLRVGIGNEEKNQNKVDFVLNKWNDNEKKTLENLFSKSCEIILSFLFHGPQNTMNNFN
jgi:PTH1 family peptidyl-tRNA hydrolase